MLAICPPTITRLIVPVGTTLQRVGAPEHAPITERVRSSVVDALVPLAAELALAEQGVGVAQRAIGVDCVKSVRLLVKCD